MKNKLFLALSLMIALIITSCSDDKDNPSGPSNKPYLSGTTGNYWIFSVAESDSLDNMILTSEIDSNVVTGKVMKAGKEAVEISQYVIDNNEVQESDPMYLYEDASNKIYMLSSSIMNFGGLGIEDTTAEEWYKVADPNDDYWKVMEREIEIEMFGMPIKGKMIVTGSKGSSKTFQVSGSNIVADTYIINVAFTGSLTFNGTTIPINIDSEQRIYLAKGIGIVSTYQKPIVIPILSTFKIPGTETKLLRYSVK